MITTEEKFSYLILVLVCQISVYFEHLSTFVYHNANISNYNLVNAEDDGMVTHY